MAKCTKCSKELTVKDFESEDEALMCSPRAFIGEGFSNFCWKSNPTKEETEKLTGTIAHVEVRNLCKKHRKTFNMAKIFVDPESARRWVKEMDA